MKAEEKSLQRFTPKFKQSKVVPLLPIPPSLPSTEPGTSSVLVHSTPNTIIHNKAAGTQWLILEAAADSPPAPASPYCLSP